jgi:predicted regulator of Ras-like GTPase activity (Roadblock/LC7/MglB family)
MFRDTIKRTVDRLDDAGGAAALLMGFDGIPVDSYARPGSTDVQTISAELTHIIAEVRRSTEGAGFGGLREMTVKTDKLALMIQLVTKDYFLALGIPPDGNLGKARYLLRLLAPQIRSEL